MRKLSLSSIRARVLVACFLLVAIAISSGLWSAGSFWRLAGAIGQTVRERQQTIDLATTLAHALEREDDALLLFLGGQTSDGQRELTLQRQRVDRILRQLVASSSGPEEETAETTKSGSGEEADTDAESGGTRVEKLQSTIETYRGAGDLIRDAFGDAATLEHYHLNVNPLLRHAVALCEQIREENFEAMRLAAVYARDEAGAAARWVIAISVLSLLLAVAVAAWLARSILRPIEQMTRSTDAIRRGDFDTRIGTVGGDELGRLASAFNLMVGSLAEYRRSSLGELLASKLTLRATLDALPDAVLLFGPKGVVVDQNPPGSDLLQVLIAPSPPTLDNLKLPTELAETIRAALQGKVSQPTRLDLRQTLRISSGGTSRRLLMTAVPVRASDVDHGHRQDGFGAVVVFDDVTEFAKLDELRSELIGVASHELKSPLTTLQMNLLMLSETGHLLTQQQRDLLSAANSGATELAATIDELLDVTRVEADQLHLDLHLCDLCGIATSVADELQGRFADAGVQLELHLETDIVCVFGDFKRLSRVLVNLLENALKYSPSGGRVAIEVTNPLLPSGERAARLSVTDQGPGVPSEFRERIFEKFVRVEHSDPFSDTANQSTPRGTGIGLYLCREITLAHRGQIVCEPAVEATGTRIVVTLPSRQNTAV